MKWIIDIINRIKQWFHLMLSDSNEVSTKKFISLSAFIMLIAVIIVSLTKTLTPDNVNLLRDALKYLTGIVMVGIFGVAAVDIFTAFKRKDD